jgi:hypothetical protein
VQRQGSALPGLSGPVDAATAPIGLPGFVVLAAAEYAEPMGAQVEPMTGDQWAYGAAGEVASEGDAACGLDMIGTLDPRRGEPLPAVANLVMRAPDYRRRDRSPRT